MAPEPACLTASSAATSQHTKPDLHGIAKSDRVTSEGATKASSAKPIATAQICLKVDTEGKAEDQTQVETEPYDYYEDPFANKGSSERVLKILSHLQVALSGERLFLRLLPRLHSRPATHMSGNPTEQLKNPVTIMTEQADKKPVTEEGEEVAQKTEMMPIPQAKAVVMLS